MPHDSRANGTSPIVHVVKFAYNTDAPRGVTSAMCWYIVLNVLSCQNGDIAIRLVMPGLQITVNIPILPILTLKLVAMATSP